MDVADINSLVPLIAAGFYTILLVIALFRRGLPSTQSRWLLLFLCVSVAWEFSYLFATTVPVPFLPLKLILLGTAVLGMTTAAFLDWSPRRRWIILGSAALLAAFLLDTLAPQAQRTTLPTPLIDLTFGTLVTYFAWISLAGLLLTKTWRSYKETRFPWHANRLLYWFIALAVLFVGEIILVFNPPVFAIIGQIIRLFGVVSLMYAIFTYRIFDVRTRIQRTLAFLVINTISALPLIAAIILILLAEQTGLLARPAGARFTTIWLSVLLALLVVLSFFFYQPFRNLVEKITYRYLVGESLNTSQVVRNYSQAISRTLDVQQLSLLIIGTLSELLETNRGALMLVTKLEDGRYDIEPIPAMGKISRRHLQIPASSPFMQTLIQQRQPLLQYDVDFNPDFSAIDDDTRRWLQDQAMEAYMPISASQEIAGLIAIGPKNSAVPYQPSELELVQILADQTVVALQNARLYSELGEQNERIRDLNRDLVDQNERLEIMDRIKSDFITIASHELRTPLTQVKGYTDILSAMNEENALTRDQTREIVGHVNRATLQLESLITAMLDASQLDVDGMQLTFVKTQIDTIIRLAVEPLMQAIRERRITLKLNGIDEIPTIRADFKRLVQAFTNIIGNAVKYTPDHGAITVDAKIVPSRNEDEPYLEIVVSDTGIGIDPKFHDLIFEKFFRIGDPQLHSTGTTKFKGAGPGLGLPIAKGVIEAHGGRIWVESEGEDEERLPGSRFHVILPMRPVGVEMEESPEETSQPAYLIG